MTVYVIGQLDIHDPEGYRAYLDGFAPSFERHGGTLLASSAQPTHVLEGHWDAPRTVVMSFPDMDHARAWYDDPEYRALCAIRERTARTNLVIVEGI
ncbi:DUF1330 domain-containing protein [Aestuariicoccus sp. MJ-SS9]|uniref:DUF1330 domain-containing protein n=1 Tax=Aestuariicoccus sp. MJ-SS9 TaxID=3079855 RepID=UPI0029092C3A|nr:DUF1330 domain-containing protein [Aestuariicoccus sp. MJ-SS9]MDU8910425.1 DUF1330 domain-containing protein [Aestuariicoccus sp. MJ-SS9]